ncbi:hypothetical protein BGX31_010908 [Mortierella sp. GBA43]|nr:hypothetical protein BGX31_010908 [Mortierella sp. GBA43]
MDRPDRHRTKTSEEVPDLRIPEEFLPIDSTQRIVLPPSPPIFKVWVNSQVRLARDLFQQQNYMQALVVIDRAKEHEYMREFSNNPSLSTKMALSHLQDLHLVEYCCRLACAHEAQLGGNDIVETMEHLNSSVLQPMRQLYMHSRTHSKDIFQLYQDPMVDYTLAILTRSWDQVAFGHDSRLKPQVFSAEQVALASVAQPFLRAIMTRRIFPSATEIFQDVTAAYASGPNSRRTILDICFCVNDYKAAMKWIWMWDRRDRKDWMDQWSQLDTKQWLVAQFSESNQPDWTLDLFRIANRASGTPHLWLQDLLTTMSNNSSSTITSEGHSLRGIMHLSDVDASAFARKKQYYDMDSCNQLDHLQSWVSGLQGLRFDPQLDRNSVEEILWREMAMVGILSKTLKQVDIIRSIKPEILAVIQPAPSFRRHALDSIPSKASGSGTYHDTLTDYLEERSIRDRGLDFAADRRITKASVLLKNAIQHIMAQYHSKEPGSELLLDSYRDLLRNVSNHVALRLGHLGLISHVNEVTFRSLYGDQLWNQTLMDSIRPRAVSNAIPDNVWAKCNNSSTTPEVLGFLRDHTRPMLARLCGLVAEEAGSTKRTREGHFSDWFMSMAESSVATGPMARALQYQGRFDSKSRAYHQAVNTLLEQREFDLAVDLHSSVYRLLEDVTPLGDKLPRPDIEELGLLIHRLATCDTIPRHLDQAQWIFDCHLEREKALVESGYSFPSGRLIDIQMFAVLGGAWFRRAKFNKARSVLETMWSHGLQPNMFLYNTLLKALLDLTPYGRPGKRVMGSGKEAGMRDRGREIMVRQLMNSKARRAQSDGDRLDSVPAERVSSELDEGWDLFQGIISMASQQFSETTRPIFGMNMPSTLRELVVGSSALVGSEKGGFRPDAYTFSILLGSLGRRGELESISELFVEMKQLCLEPDVVICSILANAFAKRGDLKAMDRVIQEARYRGLDPGLYLTNMVLDSLVEMGVSASKIREALDGMIDRVSKTEEPVLEDEMEIPVPKFGGKGSQRSQGNSMNQTLPGIDGVTLTTLIKYHTGQNDLASAQELLRLMVDSGAVPDSRVYVLLLGASIRTQDIASGLLALRAMRVYSKRLPDAKAWKGLLRCAMALELKSERQQHSQRQSTESRQYRRQVQFERSLAPDAGPERTPDGLRQNLEEEGPVVSVLMELESLLFVIRRTGVDSNSVGGHAGTSAKEYLYEILTSSWLTLSDEDASSNYTRSECESNRKRQRNPEIKGKNGLLRRLLNHLLREPCTKSAGRAGQARAERSMLSSSSPLDVPTAVVSSPQQQEHQWLATRDPTPEVERRCEHAISLARLVESSGIELGARWKRDVLVPGIHSLTGWEPALILKQLRGKGKDRV